MLMIDLEQVLSNYNPAKADINTLKLIASDISNRLYPNSTVIDASSDL